MNDPPHVTAEELEAIAERTGARAVICITIYDGCCQSAGFCPNKSDPPAVELIMARALRSLSELFVTADGADPARPSN